MSNIAKRKLAENPAEFLVDVYGKEAKLLQRKLEPVREAGNVMV